MRETVWGTGVTLTGAGETILREAGGAFMELADPEGWLVAGSEKLCGEIMTALIS
jgi:hypothetical protein